MRRDPTLQSLDAGPPTMKYLFRRMALIVDPVGGELQKLGDEYAWHATTISRWTNAGEMPRAKAQLLHKRFAKDIGFEVVDLCPSDDAE